MQGSSFQPSHPCPRGKICCCKRQRKEKTFSWLTARITMGVVESLAFIYEPFIAPPSPLRFLRRLSLSYFFSPLLSALPCCFSEWSKLFSCLLYYSGIFVACLRRSSAIWEQSAPQWMVFIGCGWAAFVPGFAASKQQKGKLQVEERNDAGLRPYYCYIFKIKF